MNVQCLIYVLGLLLIMPYAHSQCIKNGKSDTTIVAQVIDMDSVFIASNTNRSGFKYYYGVHHFKLKCLNLQIPGLSDTIVVAYVFNKLDQLKEYKKAFNINLGHKYIFYVHCFEPCTSDFPRIQGSCTAETAIFKPESNRIIKQYKSIYRIISAQETREF
jgi:hypothetical protein